jgi:hypothetical protein
VIGQAQEVRGCLQGNPIVPPGFNPFDQAHAHKSSLSAVDLSYPPFETMDEIGKGISVRIAQALADFSAAFEALADGVRWGRWPVALCQNASLLAALWARKLAGFDGDLVGEAIDLPWNH